MGSWSMNIHGHGIHDNGLADDADSLLRKFVADLRRLGHVVHGAHFTAGSAQDVTEAADPAPAASGVFGPFEKVESPPADAPATPAPEPASTEPGTP